MKIKFKINLDDRIESSWQDYLISPEQQKRHAQYVSRLRLIWYFIATLVFIIISMLAYITGIIFLYFIAITVLFLWGACIRKDSFNCDEKSIRRDLRESYKANPAYGKEEIEMEVSDNGLVMHSKYSEMLIYYKTIGRIAATPGYKIIEYQYKSVSVIPENSIIEGDLEDFMKALQAKLNDAVQ